MNTYQLKDLAIKGSQEFKIFISDIVTEHGLATNITGDSSSRYYDLNPEHRNGYTGKSFCIHYDDIQPKKHVVTFDEFQEKYKDMFIDELLMLTGIKQSYSII
jgi:hypothetical protein